MCIELTEVVRGVNAGESPNEKATVTKCSRRCVARRRDSGLRRENRASGIARCYRRRRHRRRRGRWRCPNERCYAFSLWLEASARGTSLAAPRRPTSLNSGRAEKIIRERKRRRETHNEDSETGDESSRRQNSRNVVLMRHQEELTETKRGWIWRRDQSDCKQKSLLIRGGFIVLYCSLTSGSREGL